MCCTWITDLFSKIKKDKCESNWVKHRTTIVVNKFVRFFYVPIQRTLYVPNAFHEPWKLKKIDLIVHVEESNVRWDSNCVLRELLQYHFYPRNNFNLHLLLPFYILCTRTLYTTSTYIFNIILLQPHWQAERSITK